MLNGKQDKNGLLINGRLTWKTLKFQYYKHMILDNVKVYDGKMLHARFAFSIFRKEVLAVGNIVAFRAPMLVEKDGMIDLEDVLSEDYIYSDDAINFCWEIPNIDLFGAIAFQRLFNQQIANILSDIIDADIKMKGDDIMVQAAHNGGGIHQTSGKASVSITCLRNGAALGHTGINVQAGKKAPAFAFSTNLSDQAAKDFMKRVVDEFYRLSDDIFVASTKVI